MRKKELSTNKGKNIPLPAKLALITACFFWAISFIATKTALASIPPLTVVMLRLLISSLCFLVWLFARGKRIPFHGPGWLWRLFLLSLFGTGLHYGLQTIGIQYTTASNASLYAVTGPISITIIAALFLGEKITWKKAAGIVCAMAGVVVVLGIDMFRNFELKGNLLGDLLVFTSIFMWGVFTVMGKDMTRKLSAVEMTALVTFMGTIYMLPLGWIEMSRSSFSLASIPPAGWGAVAFLGITCSFLATLLYVLALERTESQKVGVYLYMIPPMTYVAAALYLGETIGLNLLLGSIIVIAGVYITEKG
ncbi:MAG TPA: DMT family transporter [Candidatus Deferrimicrobium sp.]|nr:DMT family transporter [Candidatus Deferrimicrobium sp.]